MQKILITGFGGFIGYSLVKYLENDFEIVALDNFSTFSNHEIKIARAGALGIHDFEAFKASCKVIVENTTYYHADICDAQALGEIFSTNKFDFVVHLAALTGVRQSLNDPGAYIDVNVKGFLNLLECAKSMDVKNLIYASSSSVYGLNEEIPYTEEQKTDNPISVYAASKKANELLANVYAHLYNMNLVGLRFFTVYGPWTRPDMAAYIFMKSIYDRADVELFNEGKMLRDFTYVDDVTKSISLLFHQLNTNVLTGSNIFNVGNHHPVFTIDFLKSLERAMKKKAKIVNKPMQPGDMMMTNASTEKLAAQILFKPETKLDEGIDAMVEWFLQFYP